MISNIISYSKFKIQVFHFFRLTKKNEIYFKELTAKIQGIFKKLKILSNFEYNFHCILNIYYLSNFYPISNSLRINLVIFLIFIIKIILWEERRKV